MAKNDKRGKGKDIFQRATRGRRKEWESGGYVHGERNPERKVPECTGADCEESGGEARTMERRGMVVNCVRKTGVCKSSRG